MSRQYFRGVSGATRAALFTAARVRSDVVHAIGGTLAEGYVLEDPVVRRVAARPG